MSSGSGVQVHGDCVSKFNELKLGKNIKWIVFRISDDKKEIIVEKIDSGENATGGQGQYEAFLSQLPESEPRYAVYDFDFTVGEGGVRNKITFITWNPDSSSIKPKMVYSSSKDALKRALNGVATEVQMTDADESDYKTVIEKVSKGVR